MLLLYDRAVSGHCWKIRLFLGFLGLAHARREIDIMAGAHRTADYAAVNPRRHVPALRDGDTVVWDSQAILAYLALRYGHAWYPSEPAPHAEILGWLAVAGQDMTPGLRAARGIARFGLPGDLAAARAAGSATLDLLDAHLRAREWAVAGRPTIADVALYPYVKLAPEGGFDLAAWPAIGAWLARFEALPGYVAIDA